MPGRGTTSVWDRGLSGQSLQGVGVRRGSGALHGIEVHGGTGAEARTGTGAKARTGTGAEACAGTGAEVRAGPAFAT